VGGLHSLRLPRRLPFSPPGLGPFLLFPALPSASALGASLVFVALAFAGAAASSSLAPTLSLALLVFCPPSPLTGVGPLFSLPPPPFRSLASFGASLSRLPSPFSLPLCFIPARLACRPPSSLVSSPLVRPFFFARVPLLASPRGPCVVGALAAAALSLVARCPSFSCSFSSVFSGLPLVFRSCCSVALVLPLLLPPPPPSFRRGLSSAPLPPSSSLALPWSFFPSRSPRPPSRSASAPAPGLFWLAARCPRSGVSSAPPLPPLAAPFSPSASFPSSYFLSFLSPLVLCFISRAPGFLLPVGPFFRSLSSFAWFVLSVLPLPVPGFLPTPPLLTPLPPALPPPWSPPGVRSPPWLLFPLVSPLHSLCASLSGFALPSPPPPPPFFFPLSFLSPSLRPGLPPRPFFRPFITSVGLCFLSSLPPRPSLPLPYCSVAAVLPLLGSPGVPSRSRVFFCFLHSSLYVCFSCASASLFHPSPRSPPLSLLVPPLPWRRHWVAPLRCVGTLRATCSPVQPAVCFLRLSPFPLAPLTYSSSSSFSLSFPAPLALLPGSLVPAPSRSLLPPCLRFSPLAPASLPCPPSPSPVRSLFCFLFLPPFPAQPLTRCLSPPLWALPLLLPPFPSPCLPPSPSSLPRGGPFGRAPPRFSRVRFPPFPAVFLSPLRVSRAAWLLRPFPRPTSFALFSPPLVCSPSRALPSVPPPARPAAWVRPSPASFPLFPLFAACPPPSPFP